MIKIEVEFKSDESPKKLKDIISSALREAFEGGEIDMDWTSLSISHWTLTSSSKVR